MFCMLFRSIAYLTFIYKVFCPFRFIDMHAGLYYVPKKGVGQPSYVMDDEYI